MTTQAGENIISQAGGSIGMTAINNIYMASIDELTATSKTVLINAGDSITLQVGDNSLTINKDGNISIEGTKSITLKVGGKSLTVNADAVKSHPMVVPGEPEPGDYGDIGGYIGTKVGKKVEKVPILGFFFGTDEGQLSGVWIGKHYGFQIDQTLKTGQDMFWKAPTTPPEGMYPDTRTVPPGEAGKGVGTF